MRHERLSYLSNVPELLSCKTRLGIQALVSMNDVIFANFSP